MISCSLDALAAHEPLAGTAPEARCWVIIEQPGPWGRDALLDSHLDAAVGQRLAGAKAAGVSVVLARRPDRPERSGAAERHVWVARSAPGGMLLRHGMTNDLESIAAWDFTAVAAGHLPAFGVVQREPVTFICTHSGRDRCCAVEGRALMTEVLESLPAGRRQQVWECSHLGGHRFAPVCLTLPSGAVHGRLDRAKAIAVLDRAMVGEVVLDSLRGRSSLIAPHQAAAIEVQRRFAVRLLDDLDVLRYLDGRAVPVSPSKGVDESARLVTAEVRHPDGRAWHATVAARDLERARLESCGKDPVPGIAWTCLAVDPAPPWM